MAAHDVSGPNAAYVAQLLADYQDAPASVPDEWRRLFESGGNGDDAASDGNGRPTAPPAPEPQQLAAPAPPVAPEPPPAAAQRAEAPAAPAPEAPALPEGPAPVPVDPTLPAAVAAAMALVKAYRMHGHLAARLDPLGSEPMGDPALDETRLVPSLTPELQARIPAKLLRLYVEGDTLLDALPRLREVYAGSSAYEIEHISDHAERVWLRKAIESGSYRVQPEP
jgi:2-oxoglutarate dehydrogenase complex dehydrogenase (E1) component-like enzyme